MKSFLKALAKIITVLALLAVLLTLLNWAVAGSEAWTKATWFGIEGASWLTGTFVFVVAIAALVIAALISPSGFSAGAERFMSAVRKTAKAITDIPKNAAEGIAESLGPLAIAAGIALLAFFGLRKKGDKSSLEKPKADQGATKEDTKTASRAVENGAGNSPPKPEDLF